MKQFLLYFIISLLLSSCHSVQNESQGGGVHEIPKDLFMFNSWDDTTTFIVTFHVNQHHPAASDENPGTSDAPWKTVSKAARVLKPGERVIVHAGVYRERIAPARGGTGPDKMIGYEAAPGEEVILKGSKVFTELWQSEKGNVWSASLPDKYFSDYNPFTLSNITREQFDIMEWAEPVRRKTPYTLPRGLVFLNGELLKQVVRRNDLEKKDAHYWVDRQQKRLFVSLANGRNPNQEMIEITTERIVFGPHNPGIGYIKVKGFTIEQHGGAWPRPQEGSLSTWRGHHWIIEDNIVRWANGIGIDIGSQGGMGKLNTPRPAYVGGHIVRRNLVSDCGISGISGSSARESLVSGNTVLRCSFHDAELAWESAGIKLIVSKYMLVEGNYVKDTLYGDGIWIDFGNEYTRVTKNVILNTKGRSALIMEMSRTPNLVDHNIIWEAKQVGLLEFDGYGQYFVHNLIGNVRGTGIALEGNFTGRPTYTVGKHNVWNNLIFKTGRTIYKQAGQRKNILVNNVAVRSGLTLEQTESGLTLTLDPSNWRIIPTVPGMEEDYAGTRRGAMTAPGAFAIDSATSVSIPIPKTWE